MQRLGVGRILTILAKVAGFCQLWGALVAKAYNNKQRLIALTVGICNDLRYLVSFLSQL